MNIYETAVFLIVVVCFVGMFLASRFSALGKMDRLLDQAQKCANKGQALINEHGDTVGKLKRAGVYLQFQELEKEGRAAYRKAVPFAASLARWPLGTALTKDKLVRGYRAIGGGLFRMGTTGSLESYEDVKRGFAHDISYYNPKHLMGLVASLRTIGFFG